jgi:hypothetical protein
MGTGVAVGGSGVNVAVGVGVGSALKNEAHAESPSAIMRVKDIVLVYFQDIQMDFRWENIAPIIY